MGVFLKEVCYQELTVCVGTCILVFTSVLLVYTCVRVGTCVDGLSCTCI